MEQSKFKENEIVLYQKGNTFQLGLVKEVIPTTERYYLKQQGFPPKGEPEGEEYISYKYRVWYHTGDTSALTDESKLHKVDNAYAFLILRRKADTSSIDETSARELAADILNHINSMVIHNYSEPLFNDYSESPDDEPSTEGLVGGLYHSMEDELTELINKFKP